MVLYECKVCNFSSKLKTDYLRHLKTKKHGRNMDPNYSIEKEISLQIQNEPKMNQNEPKMNQNEPKMNQGIIKNFKCDYCDELFFTHASKRRHELHRCKKMLDIDKKLKEKNKIIEKLEKKVDKLTDRIGNTTNIQHNNTTNNTNTTNKNTINNIKINSYGKEDLSHITEDFKTSLLCGGPYSAIPKMIEAIHFNDNKPENKNIILPNLNKNILKIKEEDKWVHKNKENILLDLIDSKYLMLDDHYNLIVNGDKISKYKKDIYKRFREKYDLGDNSLIGDIKDDCGLMLMNNRNV